MFLRAYRGLILLLEWWMSLLLILMVAIVCVGIFYRYVLNAALPWYDEFASYLLVWLTFYGAVVASAHRRQIGFDTLVSHLAPRPRRFLEITAEVCVIAFQAMLFYSGWVLTVAVHADTAVSLPWVRMSWVVSVLPVSGGLMLLTSLIHLVVPTRAVRGRPDEVA